MKAKNKKTPESVADAISPPDAGRWRAEDAMRTIMRAEDHKQDKGLMAEVRKLADDQSKKMASVAKGK